MNSKRLSHLESVLIIALLSGIAWTIGAKLVERWAKQRAERKAGGEGSAKGVTSAESEAG